MRARVVNDHEGYERFAEINDDCLRSRDWAGVPGESDPVDVVHHDEDEVAIGGILELDASHRPLLVPVGRLDETDDHRSVPVVAV